jgi:hypothetical protein
MIAISAQTPSLDRASPADSRFSHRMARGAAAVGIALVGGVFAGGLTSYAQTFLPEQVNSFANSSGGWSMIAFLLVWIGRARPALAALVGVVAFEALVEGYSLLSQSRGYFYDDPFSNIFTLIGLVCGPVLGIAASLTRHGLPSWAVLGVTPLVAVLWGEGLFGLTWVADTTSPVYWILELVLGTLFLGLAIIRRHPPRRVAVLAAVLCSGGAGVFLVAYASL